MKRGLLADRLKGMRVFWCCSAMCSTAAHRRRPHPRLFRRLQTVFVELSHRPFLVPLRLCFPHHGRRDGKGQPSALYSVLASASTAAAAASFMPPRSVTVGSTKVRNYMPCRLAHYTVPRTNRARDRSHRHRKYRLLPAYQSLLFYQSNIFPSTETVTTCQGMNFPLSCSAFFAACSKPPQQGTSMRTTVTL